MTLRYTSAFRDVDLVGKQHGTSFGAARPDVALRDAFDAAHGNSNTLVTLPEFIQARLAVLQQVRDPFMQRNYQLLAAQASPVWMGAYTAYSELAAGQTPGGIDVFVVSHGGGIALSSPQRLEQAVREAHGADGHLDSIPPSPQNTFIYTVDEFRNLLDGKLPDGRDIAVVSYDVLLRDGPPPRKPWASVVELSRVLAHHPKHSGVVGQFRGMKQDPDPLRVLMYGSSHLPMSYDEAKKVVYGDDFPPDAIVVSGTLDSLDFTSPHGSPLALLGGPSGRGWFEGDLEARFVVRNLSMRRSLSRRGKRHL